MSTRTYIRGSTTTKRLKSTALGYSELETDVIIRGRVMKKNWCAWRWTKRLRCK